MTDLPLAAEELLEFAARTDIKDEFGYAPIEAASQSMHTMTYRVLLEAGIIFIGETRYNPDQDRDAHAEAARR